MSDSMRPSAILAELRHQHDDIRLLADRCAARAARQYGDDEPSAELRLALSRLRIAVGAHNRYEESVLGPVLLATDAFGAVRVDDMVRAHAAEHDLVLATMAIDTVAAARDAIAAVRRHLDDEERHFLSHRIVRDDLVTIEPGA
jgi:hypothetical protein